MSEATTAPVVTTDEANLYLMAVKTGEASPLRRVDAADLAATAALAASAVQPEDLGSAAGLSVEDIQGIIDEQLGQIAVLLQEING